MRGLRSQCTGPCDAGIGYHRGIERVGGSGGSATSGISCERRLSGLLQDLLATHTMRLKSANSDVEIEFSGVRGDEFDFRIASHDHFGARRVSAYTDADGVVRLFSEAARDWRGWSATKTWESLEGELRLQLTIDRAGHVTLTVRLRSTQGIHDAWLVETSLGLEAGQLESIAAEARQLWRAGG